MNNIYYNIKIYENIFSICFYNEKNNIFEFYYLLKNTNKIKNNIFEFLKNKNIFLNNNISFFDLSEMKNTIRVARLIGYVTPTYNYHIVSDTDDGYDPEIHPYILGYNNWNYDSTMLSLFLSSCLVNINGAGNCFKPVTMEDMYQYHVELNSIHFKGNMPNRLNYMYTEDEQAKKTAIRIKNKYLMPSNNTVSNIRRYQFNTGRHIDVARLNEKQSQANLYRQAGILGLPIYDKDLISDNDIEKIIELAVNECLIIKDLFYDKNYCMTLKLKKQLLYDYPELIYEKRPGNSPSDYRPDIENKRIRYDRMTVNSTSAQIVSNCLCPYGTLTDDNSVSYLYPSADKAKELGIKQINVLDETYDFIKNRMQPLVKDKQGIDILNKLKEMIDMYRSIEGKNFNESIGPVIEPLEQLTKNISLPYMDQNGRYSDCYCTFSIGGIHGAEYNKELYDKHIAEYEQNNTIQKPELFITDTDGSTKLNKKYTMTSAGNTNHEDFVSYYTNLLCNMQAFKNDGLGYDRYEEIFKNKEKYSILMNDMTLSQEQRNLYRIMRENTKLILTSASGAADVNYNTSIRMNNRILSMRIIGQLFTWRIGQAQALQGAKIISTNTDGLYTVMESEINNQILKKEAENIHVGIEPETLYLVSKDANNRFEAQYNGYTGNPIADLTIKSGHGLNLNAINGPVTTKAPSHPAILDYALSEILKLKALQGKFDDFPKEYGEQLIKDIALQVFNDKKEYLKMFQHIISNSEDKYIYNFALNKPYDPQDKNIKIARVKNPCRIFYVEPEKVPAEFKKNIIYLAAAYIRNDNTDTERLAVRVLKDLYHNPDALVAGTARVKRITGIEYNIPCIIVSSALNNNDFQPEWLNYDYYINLLEKSYCNWQNT